MPSRKLTHIYEKTAGRSYSGLNSQRHSGSSTQTDAFLRGCFPIQECRQNRKVLARRCKIIRRLLKCVWQPGAVQLVEFCQRRFPSKPEQRAEGHQTPQHQRVHIAKSLLHFGQHSIRPAVHFKRSHKKRKRPNSFL